VSDVADNSGQVEIPAPSGLDGSNSSGELYVDPDSRPRILKQNVSRGSGFSLKFIAMVVLLIAVFSGVAMYFRGVQKLVKKQEEVVSRQLTALELQVGYSNPFADSTAYINPFAEYKSPFASLR